MFNVHKRPRPSHQRWPLFVSHPSPVELAEMLSELQRVEERLQPFVQRAHAILETATSAEYTNHTVGVPDARRLSCFRVLSCLCSVCVCVCGWMEGSFPASFSRRRCRLRFASVSLLQEREEDQRVLVLTFEALRLLGNAIVALSDLRLNLLGPVPRHLHVLRPFSHYAAPVTLPGAVHHHIPVQVRQCKNSPYPPKSGLLISGVRIPTFFSPCLQLM